MKKIIALTVLALSGFVHAQPQSPLLWDGYVVVNAVESSARNGTYATCKTTSELNIEIEPFVGNIPRCKNNGLFAADSPAVLIRKSVDQLLVEAVGSGYKAIGVLPVRLLQTPGWAHDRIMILYKKQQSD